MSTSSERRISSARTRASQPAVAQERDLLGASFDVRRQVPFHVLRRLHLVMAPPRRPSSLATARTASSSSRLLATAIRNNPFSRLSHVAAEARARKSFSTARTIAVDAAAQRQLHA